MRCRPTLHILPFPFRRCLRIVYNRLINSLYHISSRHDYNVGRQQLFFRYLLSQLGDKIFTVEMRDGGFGNVGWNDGSVRVAVVWDKSRNAVGARLRSLGECGGSVGTGCRVRRCWSFGAGVVYKGREEESQWRGLKFERGWSVVYYGVVFGIIG
ncbi:hypothetical protein BC829DRAFT_175275 [Chytridium lagenaria]|nr:hypothetical protein BC829DRAFT_175275 [Chytridium lagenaria]